MKNTLQINYWTIGGFENTKPVADALRDAKELGYDGIELTFEAAGVLCPDTDEKTCRGYRDAAEKLGLEIKTLCTGVSWNVPLGSLDAAQRRDAVEFTKRYLQAAAWIGAETILVIPAVVAQPWVTPKAVTPYAEAWDNATRSLWKVLPVAEKLGVNIGLENVWNWFLADPVAMRTFVDQFDSPYLGVYFDLGNCLLNGFAEHWIPILGHRIKAVHAKNFKREDSGGVLHGFGDDILGGDLDWPAVKDALAAADYEGPITAEMIPFSRLPDLVLPDLDMARDTIVKLRRVLAD